MENKLFYIRGSKTNPEGVKKALLEKYPNMCNQSLVVWTQEDMLIYVDGDDCCSCCYDDSTVGRTLIKYGEEIDGYSSHLSPIVLTDKILKANGFKNCVVIAGCDKFVIDYIFEKLCEDCVIQITLNPYVIDIFPYDAENNKTADKAVYTIPFGDGGVHELQQALGLCGLSEIADDFKIE